MSFIPVDNAHITQTLLNDAMQWRQTIQWAQQRYEAYNQNCSGTAMTAAGISSGDQGAIFAFIGDLHRFVQLASATLPSDATDMMYDVSAILGVL